MACLPSSSARLFSVATSPKGMAKEPVSGMMESTKQTLAFPELRCAKKPTIATLPFLGSGLYDMCLTKPTPQKKEEEEEEEATPEVWAQNLCNTQLANMMTHSDAKQPVEAIQLIPSGYSRANCKEQQCGSLFHCLVSQVGGDGSQRTANLLRKPPSCFMFALGSVC